MSSISLRLASLSNSVSRIPIVLSESLNLELLVSLISEHYVHVYLELPVLDIFVSIFCVDLVVNMH